MRIMIIKHRKHSPACVWKILISLLHALHQQKSSLNFALCVKLLREEYNHTSSKTRGILLHTLTFYYAQLIQFHYPMNDIPTMALSGPTMTLSDSFSTATTTTTTMVCVTTKHNIQ